MDDWKAMKKWPFEQFQHDPRIADGVFVGQRSTPVSAFNKLRDILERKGSQWDCAVGHFYVGRVWFVSRAEDGEWCSDEHDCCNSCEFKEVMFIVLAKTYQQGKRGFLANTAMSRIWQK